MAFLNWKAVIFMFIVVLVNIRTASGLLIVKPKETFVLAGQVATLNCSTSLTEDVHWYYGTSYVYAGRNLYSPYKERLKIEVYQLDDSTAYNLVFPSAKPEDAGMYVCRDLQGRGETSSTEMTVFTADVNGTCQSNMKTDGVVIPNDCNIDPDEVQLSCGVTFNGKNPPQLEWKKVPDNGYGVAKTECQTTNNRIMCNASIVGDRQMNHSSYVCQTDGSSQLNIKICTIEVTNLIYAFNGQTMAKFAIGNEVQCNPDTSQSCNYKWKHSGIVVSTSRTIKPDRIGLYQCEAECNIRGKRCIVFNYAFISDDDSIHSACNTTGYVVGLDTSRSVQDLEMKTHESGTQQERTILLQPRKKMKKIVDEPELIRTLVPEAASKIKKAIFGLTILGDELFVLRNECLIIDVFGDLQKLEPRKELSLEDQKLDILWDMQSSSQHDKYCLYIVHIKRNEEKDTEIIKIDPSGIVQNRWATDCIEGRLSVTSEFNVIVASLYQHRVSEYSPDGDLIRWIELPSNVGIASLWVALKRGKDEYIISHGNKGDSQHGVCVCDQNRKLKHYFGSKRGQSSDPLCVPVHVTAYSDGHILIADKDNHRVVLLSPELKFLAALFSNGVGLRFPNRLCLDERNKRLYVSDNKRVSNLKPWKDGRVLVFDMSSVQTTFSINAHKN